jgi:hypothetical protein
LFCDAFADAPEMTAHERRLAARLIQKNIPWVEANQLAVDAITTYGQQNGTAPKVLAFFARRRVNLIAWSLLLANTGTQLADLPPYKSFSTKQADSRNRIYDYACNPNC